MKINRKVMLFEQWIETDSFNSIFENVTGEIKDVQGEVDKVMSDLKAEGTDAETDEVKAAILMQALDNDGNIEAVDIDKAKEEVKEGIKLRGQTLNESAEGIIHTLELIGSVAGNADLMHFILNKVEKATGKKMDQEKVQGTITKIIEALKKVTGLPAKALIKFFDWVSRKLGLSDSTSKALDVVGRIAVLVFFLTLGVIHFPVLGTSVIMWVLSLTGIIGKSVEIVHLGKEMAKMIVDAGTNKDKTKEEIGLSPEEMEAMIA